MVQLDQILNLIFQGVWISNLLLDDFFDRPRSCILQFLFSPIDDPVGSSADFLNRGGLNTFSKS